MIHVYCDDIPGWHAYHPEVIERIPPGYEPVWATTTGFWCEFVGDEFDDEAYEEEE